MYAGVTTEMKMAEYIIRDKETDEIKGIDKKAPLKLKIYFRLYMLRRKLPIPVVK